MISDWLSAYFKLAEGEVELRALPDKRDGGTPEHVYSRDADVLEAFVEKWDRPGHGVFFGACTRKPGTRKAGKVADAYRMPAYWVDIDGTPKDEAIKAFAGCRLPPSAIVDSGRGVHAYWLLNRPIDVSEALSNDHEAVGTLKRL